MKVYLSMVLSSPRSNGERGGVRYRELAALPGSLLPVQRSSVHTQLWHIWKTSSKAARRRKKKELLNQFHSPVNYNPAFLISSLHTMLFIGIQAKHGPLQLCGTNCPLMQSLPVRSTEAWLKKCIPWCRAERCVRWWGKSGGKKKKRTNSEQTAEWRCNLEKWLRARVNIVSGLR